MKTKTDLILKIMYILSWIVFVGLLVKAGALLLAYGVSTQNPNAANNLYLGLNLRDILDFSFFHFSILLLFYVTTVALQAYALFLLIKILDGVDLKNPFTLSVASLIEKVSYIILSVWGVSVIANIYTNLLQEKIVVGTNFIFDQFLFLAGIIFIIAQIFKKGVELQNESELTV